MENFFFNCCNRVKTFSVISTMKHGQQMKTMTINAALNAIKNGRFECVTDLKIGYVEIYRMTNRKREIILITK